MEWNDCIEEAKEELGIYGWTNDWDEVVSLAKEKYWDRESFKELKEETIEYSDGRCAICSFSKRLTAHHIFYGKDEETICLCKNCHKMVHKDLKKHGFVLQLFLLKIINPSTEIPNNLVNYSLKIQKEIKELIKKRENKE